MGRRRERAPSDLDAAPGRHSCWRYTVNPFSPLEWMASVARSPGDMRLAWQDLQTEIDARVDGIPARLDESGYDPWGYSPETLKKLLLPLALLYRYYFRCETTGLDRLPEGRVLLVGNHAGQLPFDAAMVTAAMAMDADPPRLARCIGEYRVGPLPWLEVLLGRIGADARSPGACIDMLGHGECIVAFPEGERGMTKVFADAYELMDFQPGFMRLALATETPVVPVAIVGSEEQQPGIARLQGLGALAGMQALPVTLTFPWLGPLGLWPLPVRYHIEFGEPILFEGDPNDGDEAVAARVEEVRDAIRAQLDRGRARRRSVFF